MFGELLKAPISRLVILLGVFTLLACPGALSLWALVPDQFSKLPTFQLLILSVGLILPFVALNAILVVVAFRCIAGFVGGSS